MDLLKFCSDCKNLLILKCHKEEYKPKHYDHSLVWFCTYCEKNIKCSENMQEGFILQEKIVQEKVI